MSLEVAGTETVELDANLGSNRNMMESRKPSIYLSEYVFVTTWFFASSLDLRLPVSH